MTACIKPRIQKDRRGESVMPTYSMRERIAAALVSARPIYHDWQPTDAYNNLLWRPKDQREAFEKEADRLLQCFDHLALGVVELDEER